jgi:hypothetical protein
MDEFVVFFRQVGYVDVLFYIFRILWPWVCIILLFVVDGGFFGGGGLENTISGFYFGYF